MICTGTPGGMAGAWSPLLFQKAGNGGRGAFHITASWVVWWFVKIDWNQIHCSFRARRKFRILYNFCYYFWGQHCWWTEKKQCFRCPQLFYCSPCPIAALASLNMHVVSTNFTKTLVWNLNMTSYCDVTNNVHPVTMTTIRHPSILGFGRGASNQAVAPGISRPLHATVEKIKWAARTALTELLET